MDDHDDDDFAYHTLGAARHLLGKGFNLQHSAEVAYYYHFDCHFHHHQHHLHHRHHHHHDRHRYQNPNLHPITGTVTIYPIGQPESPEAITSKVYHDYNDYNVNSP